MQPPTGSRPAILFFRQEVGNFNGVPGIRMVETGYFFGIPSGRGSVRFIWAQPPPAGYQPQTATILAQLSGGKIVAYLAQLTARGLPRVRVLMSAGTVYLSSGKCWTKATASASPLGTGDRFLLNGGGARFLPLHRAGRSTSTIFTYPWGPASHARETDTFGPGNAPTVHVTIEVTGAQKLHIQRTIHPLASAPTLPVPAPPAAAEPKPLCSSR